MVVALLGSRDHGRIRRRDDELGVGAVEARVGCRAHAVEEEAAPGQIERDAVVVGDARRCRVVRAPARQRRRSTPTSGHRDQRRDQQSDESPRECVSDRPPLHGLLPSRIGNRPNPPSYPNAGYPHARRARHSVMEETQAQSPATQAFAVSSSPSGNTRASPGIIHANSFVARAIHSMSVTIADRTHAS